MPYGAHAIRYASESRSVAFLASAKNYSPAEATKFMASSERIVYLEYALKARLLCLDHIV